MNKLFQRTIKKGLLDRSLLLTKPIKQHYQADLLRQPQPFIVIIPDPLPQKEKLVIPRPQINEFDGINRMEIASVERMNRIMDENKRNPPPKKPIMTPDGIRTEKLVMPPPPKDAF